MVATSRHWFLACASVVVVGLLASMLSVPGGAAAAPPPIPLGRDNLVVVGTLEPGGSTSYTVNYDPQYELRDMTKRPVVLGRPAPWLIRMWIAAPGALPGSISFTWLDQTSPLVDGSTAGNSGRSTTPKNGGDITDVPPGVAAGNVQQAVVTGGSPGPFSVTLFNGSTVRASYRLQVYPLLNGQLEPGINPNPTPIPAPAQPATSTTGVAS